MPSWQDHRKCSRPNFTQYLLILSVFKTGGSKTHFESVKVVVVPANGSRPHMATLPLIETPIRPATMPTDPEQNKIFLRARAASTVYHDNIAACEPNIRFLPDTLRSGHWDQKSWDFRSVVGVPRRFKDDERFPLRYTPPGLHLFYTLSKNGVPNSTFGNVVCGDVFLLKISDFKKDGLHYYADIGKGDVYLYMLDDLLGELIEQRREPIENPDWSWDPRGPWRSAIIDALET